MTSRLLILALALALAGCASAPNQTTSQTSGILPVETMHSPAGYSPYADVMYQQLGRGR